MTANLFRPAKRHGVRWLSLALAAGTIAAGACGGDDDDTTSAGRVDLGKPSFSQPTSVTNPLLPVSQIHSALMLGTDDGKPLRIEITLLPGTKTIDWEGTQIEVLVSQLTAYEDGRIHEVALDWFGQADDGSVWYFGEDTANYEDGVIEDTEGSWLAGKDGPPSMIMPATPKVGDVFRPEDIPDHVFEEFTVTSTGVRVDGPSGPVEGAVVVRVRQEDEKEEKTFTPGYGEFSGGAGGDSEVMALAVPTDALEGNAPPELELILASAARIFEAVRSDDWQDVQGAHRELGPAWSTFRGKGGVPKLLGEQMEGALDSLGVAVKAKNSDVAAAALAVRQASLDLLLRHRPPAQIDLARFELWVDQLELDTRAAKPNPGFVAAGATTLETIWARIEGKIDPAQAAGMSKELEALRTAVDGEDMAAARKLVPALRTVWAGLALQ